MLVIRLEQWNRESSKEQRSHFNLHVRNEQPMGRFGKFELASTARKYLYGPMSLLPNSAQIPYGSRESVSSELPLEPDIEGDASSSSLVLFPGELVRENMFIRHLKISSDSLFGPLDSDSFGALDSSNFASLELFRKFIPVLSLSTELHFC
ncbi:hypothetical protein BHE74_00044392 [Ensete ventricosum]|uniref:Uncharacterized protein n=1 Tax=Ensete ventricosum TaxID=4639 RepID=A0A444FQT4_ENSVE|nr:hypothetical protein B296_00006092 [Ensete ventricosum]RWW24973.1 hypothetical protein GW17_00010717 [Ensete ventricosum]RWW49466.1 hypothetical protein BHE74_00044392 [Ensete ventricosum]RZR72046.1 hypothetical protein BHM03_00009887 [Ensete ventricosum]